MGVFAPDRLLGQGDHFRGLAGRGVRDEVAGAGVNAFLLQALTFRFADVGRQPGDAHGLAR